MRVLALDVGDARIGTAISDPTGLFAQGLRTIQRRSVDEDVREVLGIVNGYGVDRVVVGLPRNMDGSEGPQFRKVQEFIEVLKRNLPLPVDTWDERLSTVAAERSLLEADVSRRKRRRVIDKMAAAVILEGYLARHRNEI